jgi:hypothetical protein
VSQIEELERLPEVQIQPFLPPGPERYEEAHGRPLVPSVARQELEELRPVVQELALLPDRQLYKIADPGIIAERQTELREFYRDFVPYARPEEVQARAQQLVVPLLQHVENMQDAVEAIEYKNRAESVKELHGPSLEEGRQKRLTAAQKEAKRRREARIADRRENAAILVDEIHTTQDMVDELLLLLPPGGESWFRLHGPEPEEKEEEAVPPPEESAGRIGYAGENPESAEEHRHFGKNAPVSFFTQFREGKPFKAEHVWKLVRSLNKNDQTRDEFVNFVYSKPLRERSSRERQIIEALRFQNQHGLLSKQDFIDAYKNEYPSHEIKRLYGSGLKRSRRRS